MEYPTEICVVLLYLGTVAKIVHNRFVQHSPPLDIVENLTIYQRTIHNTISWYRVV